MQVLFLKKIYIYIFIIIIISLSVGIFIAIRNPLGLSTYKDRDRWELSGDIIWEIKTEEKLIALTFDDGPSPVYTPQIIDLLADYNAKATFFVVGEEVERYPDIINKMDEHGHEIANHTYTHKEVNNMSKDELLEELKKTHQLVYDLINKDMNLFRPTSGFYNEIIVNAAKELNYTVVIWTWGQDSKDWQNIDYNTIATNVYKSVEPGNIVLFHDRGGKRENTIKALHIILPVLNEKGYKFVTVSELLNQNELQIDKKY
ncbi:polysaccharide deacetylase family protein [Natronospora cellulosivora (SeqCode)]